MQHQPFNSVVKKKNLEPPQNDKCVKQNVNYTVRATYKYINKSGGTQGTSLFLKEMHGKSVGL